MPSPTPDAVASRDEASAFILELAPEPSLIVTARLFAAGVAREAGCAEERVEDVKLGVSEACGIALDGVEPPALRIDARRTPGRLAFSVGPVREGGASFATPEPATPEVAISDEGPPLPVGSLPRGLDLIALLFDDARIDRSAVGEGGALHFSVPVDTTGDKG
jgi:Histidine kinase-like ATPase domain